MAKQILFVSIFFLSCVWSVSAQQNVFEVFLRTDSVNAEVNFFQDRRIEQLFLDRQQLSAGEEISGFRVQVFSSNNHQTARSEAFRIKALVEEQFPDRGVYETFNSPFWRVRVGDFRTREEAQELLAELRRTFPAFGREMYVVQDMINVRH